MERNLKIYNNLFKVMKLYKQSQRLINTKELKK